MKISWIARILLRKDVEALEREAKRIDDLSDKCLEILNIAEAKNKIERFVTIKSFSDDDMEYMRKIACLGENEELKFFLYVFEHVALPQIMIEKKFGSDFLLYVRVIMQELWKNIYEYGNIYSQHLKSLEAE